MLLLAHADMSTTAVARTLPADAAECMHGLADVCALALRGVSVLSVLRVAPTLSLLTDSHPRCRCSRTVDGARRAVQAGAIAAVIDALARHCDRPDVAVMACTAVSHLAAESSASSFASPITKLGLIHSLTHLLLTVASPSHTCLSFSRPAFSAPPPLNAADIRSRLTAGGAASAIGAAMGACGDAAVLAAGLIALQHLLPSGDACAL